MSEEKKSKELTEPFLVALKLEREGRRLFVEAARTTTSKLARQTFEFLAEEEDRHIEKIEAFYKSVTESGTDDLPDIEDSRAEEKLVSFNEKLATLKDDFQSTESDAEAYRMALKLENGAEELYAKMIEQSDDPKLKRFYKWLLDEETMHSRLLNSCLKFVEDPGEWFRRRQ